MLKKPQAKILIFTIVFVMLATVITPVYAAKPAPSTNSPPVISNEDPINLITDASTPINFTVTATDANKDTLSWSTSSPAKGAINQVSVSNVKGKSTVTYRYTPNSSFTSGTDSFTVTVKDKLASDSITVIISIRQATIEYLDYVALGDSLATGTIYPGKTITPYVTYFKDYLITNNPGITVRAYNLAQDGNRTNELYSKLGLDGSTGDASLIARVAEAEVITLSIGGNNLMQATKDPNALGGYDFFKINTAVADQGLKDFQDQWVQIMNKIVELSTANNAKIIVTTTYNPYNISDLGLYNTVNSYLYRSDKSGLNDIILANTNIGYSVADVYGKFNSYSLGNNMKQVVYLYALDLWEYLTKSPHPRYEGQMIFTNEIKSIYIK